MVIFNNYVTNYRRVRISIFLWFSHETWSFNHQSTHINQRPHAAELVGLSGAGPLPPAARRCAEPATEGGRSTGERGETRGPEMA